MAFDIKVNRKEQNKIDLEKRKTTFDEVIVPFKKEDILEQSKRCLSCPVPQCEKGCPIHLPIRDMIKLISTGNEKEAYKIINDVSPLSGICSIVCDHASQCEGKCIRGIKDKPVNIGAIHRYVAFLDEQYNFEIGEEKQQRIAIIGAGPSGLTCAIELRKLGYQVTVFEKESKIGGVPYYGIPNFRLEMKDLDKVLSSLENIGINFIVNKEINVNDIIDEYDAIYIAIGTQKSKYMRIPGEELKGVYTSEEFLRDIKIDKNYTKYESYKNIFVVGGGNVAMDVSRTAIRMGKDTTIVYRRSIEEAPCRKDELEEAAEEGVKLHFLNNPIEFIGNDKLEKIKLIKMELGEQDASGRRSPVEIKGSEYLVDADCVVLAIGQGIEKQFVDGVELKWNLITVNENHQTNNPKVFAGGDVVTGSNTVVHAINAGIETSKAIDNYLKL